MDKHEKLLEEVESLCIDYTEAIHRRSDDVKEGDRFGSIIHNCNLATYGESSHPKSTNCSSVDPFFELMRKSSRRKELAICDAARPTARATAYYI